MKLGKNFSSYFMRKTVSTSMKKEMQVRHSRPYSKPFMPHMQRLTPSKGKEAHSNNSQNRNASLNAFLMRRHGLIQNKSFFEA